MRRYLLFECIEAAGRGGFSDYMGSFDTKKDAKDAAIDFIWPCHIVDSEKECIIATRDMHGEGWLDIIEQLGALRYLRDVGDEITTDLFDEDNQPSGNDLRDQLVTNEYAEVYEREDAGVLFIRITYKGKEALYLLKDKYLEPVE